MKMYYGVLQRVKQVEEKNGIKYLTTNSMIYKLLSVFLIIAVIYTMCVNLIMVMSGLIRIYSLNNGIVATIEGKDYSEVEYWEYKGLDAKQREQEIVNNNRALLLNAGISAALILAGFILHRCKLYLLGGISMVASSVYQMLYFKQNLTNSGGIVGLSAKYYWRHLIPLSIIVIMAVILTVIAVRARYKLQKQYKKVTENLFNMYNIPLSAEGSISDEQWDEFLRVYDPKTKYKKQFAIAENENEQE